MIFSGEMHSSHNAGFLQTKGAEVMAQFPCLRFYHPPYCELKYDFKRSPSDSALE